MKHLNVIMTDAPWQKAQAHITGKRKQHVIPMHLASDISDIVYGCIYFKPKTSTIPLTRLLSLTSRRHAGSKHSGQHPFTRKASSMQLRQNVSPHPDTVQASYMVSQQMLHRATASTADII